MAVAHAPRAVIFALEDLPAGDRQHILAVAQHLKLPQDPASWRTPLVLTSREPGPLLPGLSDDVELAGGGPSLLLLAMRLLLADAWSWPEQHFLGSSSESQAGYALYAADPERWTAETLARELLDRARAEVQRGLQPRSERTWAPADRVPVLGWQVPVLGRPDPVGQLRDLRPAEARVHRFGGVALPLGVAPGALAERHRLFVRLLGVARDGDSAEAEVEVLRADGANGELLAERLRLRVGDVVPLGAPEGDDEALSEALREVLPGALFCCPQGGLLLLDLHGLGLSLAGRGDGALGALQVATTPTELPEDEGAGVLDPGLWEPGTLAGLLHPEECRVSRGARVLSLRFGGHRDGAPVDAALLLEVRSGQPLLWQTELGGPAPRLALSDDEGLLALQGAGVLAPACFAGDDPGEWLAAHDGDVVLAGLAQGGPLSIHAAVKAPIAGPLSLSFLPGGRTLLCFQAAQQVLFAVEHDDPARPVVRAATGRDVLALLQSAEARRLLRTVLSEEDDEVAAEEFPLLGALATVLAAPLRGEAAELLALPPGALPPAMLRRARVTLRSHDGRGLIPLPE